jgi:hypothetical protein
MTTYPTLLGSRPQTTYCEKRCLGLAVVQFTFCLWVYLPTYLPTYLKVFFPIEFIVDLPDGPDH